MELQSLRVVLFKVIVENVIKKNVKQTSLLYANANQHEYFMVKLGSDWQ